MADTKPIIIIGAARSGTKFLRDVLASVDGVRAVPYDVNYVWRYGVEDTPSDVLDPSRLNDKKIDFIRTTISSLAGLGKNDVLVEKTVSNSIRIPYVDRVYPEARYVHLIRDGRDVAESAMRQWQASPRFTALWVKLKGVPLANFRYVFWFAKNIIIGLFSGRKGGGVWGPRFPGIAQVLDSAGLAEVCARQWVESVSRAGRGLASVPDSESRVFEIRYEDLMANENAIIELVADLEMPHQDKIVDNFKKMRTPGRPSRWQELSSEDRNVLDKILTPIMVQMDIGG